jgi:hypothetical protein
VNWLCKIGWHSLRVIDDRPLRILGMYEVCRCRRCGKTIYRC